MLAERVLPTPRLRPSRLLILLPLAGALLTVLPGCGTFALLAGRFEPPEVTLTDSKVESVSRSAAAVMFALDVYNPNSYGLRLRSMRYRVKIGGATVAQGEAPAGVGLPAHGMVTVHLPAQLDFDTLTSAAHAALMTGEIPYQLDAWLRVGTMLLSRDLTFSDSSALRLNLPLGLAHAAGVASSAAGCQS